MRTLAVTQNITVDGRIEMLDPWFEPSDQDQELAAFMHQQEATNDAVLLGRQTFEDFRGFWPQQTQDTTGTRDHLDTVHKYVWSSTLADPAWRNSTVLTGDLRTQITGLKHADGGDIVVTGSIRLTQALLAAGLVDELRLFVYPAIQGRGRGLTAEGAGLGELTLTETQTFSAGVNYAAYRVGG